MKLGCLVCVKLEGAKFRLRGLYWSWKTNKGWLLSTPNLEAKDLPHLKLTWPPTWAQFCEASRCYSLVIESGVHHFLVVVPFLMHQGKSRWVRIWSFVLQSQRYGKQTPSITLLQHKKDASSFRANCDLDLRDREIFRQTPDIMKTYSLIY